MKLIPITAQEFKEKYPDDYVDGQDLQYFNTDIGMGIIKDTQLGQISVTKIEKDKEDLFDEQMLLVSLSSSFNNGIQDRPRFEDIGGFDGDDEEIYKSPFNYAEEDRKKVKQLQKLHIHEFIWNLLSSLMLSIIVIFIVYVTYRVITNGDV